MCSFLKQAIIGLVLGGGANISCRKDSLEGPSLRAYTSVNDSSWMTHLSGLFGFMCNQEVITTTSSGTLKSGTKVAYEQLLLYTMQLWELMDLYKLLYVDGFKAMPEDLSWFDVVTLSYFVIF